MRNSPFRCLRWRLCVHETCVLRQYDVRGKTNELSDSNPVTSVIRHNRRLGETICYPQAMGGSSDVITLVWLYLLWTQDAPELFRRMFMRTSASLRYSESLTVLLSLRCSPTELRDAFTQMAYVGNVRAMRTLHLRIHPEDAHSRLLPGALVAAVSSSSERGMLMARKLGARNYTEAWSVLGAHAVFSAVGTRLKRWLMRDIKARQKRVAAMSFEDANAVVLGIYHRGAENLRDEAFEELQKIESEICKLAHEEMSAIIRADAMVRERTQLLQRAQEMILALRA